MWNLFRSIERAGRAVNFEPITFSSFVGTCQLSAHLVALISSSTDVTYDLSFQPSPALEISPTLTNIPFTISSYIRIFINKCLTSVIIYTYMFRWWKWCAYRDSLMNIGLIFKDRSSQPFRYQEWRHLAKQFVGFYGRDILFIFSLEFQDHSEYLV